ncbi:MAG: RNA polymerase sigma factor [Phycisphaerae bacterium]
MRNTQWTQIMLVQQGQTQQRRDAMGCITRQYWKPVYSFLRNKGMDNETAKDITQGFFADVILGRQLIDRADPGQGRFRSYLLAAVSNYARDYHRRQNASTRSPQNGVISLEGCELTHLLPDATDQSPAEAFNRSWAHALLDSVLEELEASCSAAGQQRHWLVFCERHLAPIRQGRAPTPYNDICDKLGIDSASQATTMNVTVKRKFETILRRQVRQLVESDSQVDQEINELMAALSRCRPGSSGC